MKLYHQQIETIIEFSSTLVPALVVEEPVFFRSLLMELYAQQSGADGRFALEENWKPLPLSTHAEVIDQCLRLSLNSRPILSKVLSAMEKAAIQEEFFLKTTELLQQVELYLSDLAFQFDCDIVCERCTPAGLLKAAGISLRDDYDDPLERLLDYMELVRTFDRDKLFILVNLRSMFADAHLHRFLETALSHGYHILLLDSYAREKLPLEQRITIDNDLCEF